jgi:hypothetical protein
MKEMYGKESIRSLEQKFLGYHAKMTGKDHSSEMSEFETQMFKAIERRLGEMGYIFPRLHQPIFFKRAS